MLVQRLKVTCLQSFNACSVPTGKAYSTWAIRKPCIPAHLTGGIVTGARVPM